jgi:hypothetical protein
MMANHQQTDEDRDTERALELYDSARHERDTAFMCLRLAVRAGDLNAMKAAYEGKNGFIIGTGSMHGYSERIVFEEVLNNSDLPLDILGVFFRDLGGRFIVDLQYHVCVFSMLIMMEYEKRTDQVEEEVERLSSRIAEVVLYLVDEIKYPIRMRESYRVRALNGHYAPLLQLARDSEAWACYTAFSQFDSTPNFVHCLEFILKDRRTGITSDYWFKLFAAKIHENPLGILSETPGFLPEHTAFLRAEGGRRMQTREHMQALLLLQSHDPGNAAARAVMNNHALSHMILVQAFEDAFFYRV